MTQKELRRLSRADLLQMLITQSEELEQVKQQLAQAQTALEDRRIIAAEAGSIAEASLRLNGVFDAAQAACEQYLENIRRLNEQTTAICEQREIDSCAQANHIIAEAVKRAQQLQQAAEGQCTRQLESTDRR